MLIAHFYGLLLLFNGSNAASKKLSWQAVHGSTSDVFSPILATTLGHRSLLEGGTAAVCKHSCRQPARAEQTSHAHVLICKSSPGQWHKDKW